LVGLVGLVGGLYGLCWLQGAAEQMEQNVVSGMDFGLEGLETISETLIILNQTVDDTVAALDTAVLSSQSTAETLDAIRPAVQELSDVVTSDLPETIRAIQDTMPALEQASSAIDTTLRTLAAFQWSTVIPIVNYELGFGLGIEYDPPIPLNASVAQMSAALSDIPDHLAGIQADLLRTDHSLGQTAASVAQMGESLDTVSQDLHATSEAIEEYQDLVARATNQMRRTRWNIRQQIQTGRVLLSGVLVWLALSQLAPLYLGCTLLGSPRPNTDER